MDVFDSSEIEITCTNCGRKTEKTVRWIKNNSQFTCPCGTTIRLDTAQFKGKIAEVEASIARLQDSFKKFGK